jgi:hypothetical protein
MLSFYVITLPVTAFLVSVYLLKKQQGDVAVEMIYVALTMLKRVSLKFRLRKEKKLDIILKIIQKRCFVAKKRSLVVTALKF